MAKVHKTYRLDADLVAQVEQWASDHGITQGEAMAQLLSRGLEEKAPTAEQADGPTDSGAGDEGALVEVLRGNVADLRRQVDTLTHQLEGKDEQINGLMKLAGNAQALQGAAEARALKAAETGTDHESGLEAELVQDADAHEPEDGPREQTQTAGEDEPRGFLSWLKGVLGI